ECGRMAAHELLNRGYKNIGFLGGPEPATSTQDRFTGFQNELQKHPEAVLSYSFAEAYSFDAGRKEMQRLLRGASHAEAYFCGDDVLSIGALSAIKEAGLNVPSDIGIIGLNDMQMSGWQNINLTTIRQPIAQIINASIELMVSMLEKPDRYPEARVFPCAVIERGTLRAPQEN
ncbi:MAG: substrate-binding domain-containing protein, partial [Paracoccaceae bacterium]